jgi:acid stress-induced BolA-like protein IbaG/YrbA
MPGLIVKIYMNPTLLTKKIQSALPGAIVNVSSHDNVHFQATVTYHGFAGKTKVAQHRMVYAPLQDDFQEALHALQLTTLIPTESS